MSADDERSAVLADRLERLAGQSMEALAAVLALPIDAANGPALRAIVAAANGGLNAQLRADAMRLRALREDKALAALLAVIASKEGTVPPCPDHAVGRVVNAALVSADTVPFLA